MAVNIKATENRSSLRHEIPKSSSFNNKRFSEERRDSRGRRGALSGEECVVIAGRPVCLHARDLTHDTYVYCHSAASKTLEISNSIY